MTRSDRILARLVRCRPPAPGESIHGFRAELYARVTFALIAAAALLSLARSLGA